MGDKNEVLQEEAPEVTEKESQTQRVLKDRTNLVKQFVPFGVTSFAELDVVSADLQKRDDLIDLYFSFMQMADDILFAQVVPLPQITTAMTRLTMEFLDRMSRLETLSETFSLDREASAKNGQIALYKDIDGVLHWGGVPTNKFIDRSVPPDIFAESAHQKFVKDLQIGNADFPSLFIWHMPVEVGITSWVDYDDRGFLTAGGTIHKQWEPLVLSLIMNSDEPMGMSHGVWLKDIVRDEEETHVIRGYKSYEFSLLPLSEAANLLTSFSTS